MEYDDSDTGPAQSSGRYGANHDRLHFEPHMLDALYRRRLERDLEVWRDRGWVSADAAGEILDSVGHGGRPRTAIVVGFLGAILIAFAAIAFVAANWAEMGRPFRLGLLVAGMAVCYALAAILSRARHPWFADAAIFAGAALFGASIILVAQSYHISGDYPDALLSWGAGAYVAALLGPSRAALALALVVLGLWSWYEVIDFGWVIHWPFPLALVPIAVLAGAWGWSAGLHLTVLALAGWIAVTIIDVATNQDWSAAAATCLALAVALLFLAVGRFLAGYAQWPKSAAFGPVLAIYGLIAFLALLILLQLAMFDSGLPDLTTDRLPLAIAAVLIAVAAGLFVATRTGLGTALLDAGPPVAIATIAVGLATASGRSEAFAESLGLQILLGVLTLVAGVWAVAWGNRTGSRAAATFGLIGFAGEVLYLYFVTFGTLLDTALFFLIGGILMVALAAILVRLQRRLGPAEPGDAA